VKQAIIQNAFEEINATRQKPWKNEDEVRLAWVFAINTATGLNLHTERGYKDASLNHVIVEFKAPGLFNGNKNSPKFIEATEQRLLPYIQTESQTTGIPESDFIGNATTVLTFPLFAIYLKKVNLTKFPI
jgi:hypothetical protein